MQSRRHEENMTQSPNPKLRNRRYELGYDPYLNPRRDGRDRSQRSVSPRNIDGSRRVSIERREYVWHLGGGRSDRVRSRSPPDGQVLKKANFDEGSSHRNRSPPLLETKPRYELAEAVDYRIDDVNFNPENVVYGREQSRISKEDYSESRMLDTGSGHGMLGRKSMGIEDREVRGGDSYRFPLELGPTSHYRETGGHGHGHLPSSSRSMDMDGFEHERIGYRNSEKFSIVESYKEAEKPMFHSRDVPHPVVPASQSRDLVSTSQLTNPAGTSSGILRSEHPGSYRDGFPLPSADEYSINTRKILGPVGFNAYGERQIMDSGRDSEAARRNLALYQRRAYSPSREEREDNVYTKQQTVANEYPYDDLRRMMPPRDRYDYDCDRIDYDRRDLSRQSNIPPGAERIEIIRDSYGNPRKSIILNHPSLQNSTVSEYLDDMSRTTNASKQGGEYFGPEGTHVEFGRRVSQNHEMLRMEVSQDHQISYLRSDRGFGREAGPVIPKESSLKIVPVSRSDPEMHKVAVRVQRMEENEIGIHEQKYRTLKRKYIMEEDTSRHSSRSVMLSKWNQDGELQDPYGTCEEWIDEDTSGSYLSRTAEFGYNSYRKDTRASLRGRTLSDDLFSSQHPIKHAPGRSVGFYKHGSRYLKGQSGPSTLAYYNPNYFDKKSGPHKQHRVGKRYDEYHHNVEINDDDASDDWVNPAKLEPSEDTEEFKQLVHEAFLKYSKKLNLNSGVQRRYKEQGKAGSLFCIVCGRSSSKEFMDTQRLVTHAFMSHKVGLRAEHLGLHKAICVLLGWNREVAPDTVTWVPQVLTNVEALAQKEDLILWPPVIIIHNISMSINNPLEQKVVSIEQVEAFLRDNGFVGGKIKVCLGKPADQSVMLVKFLGTFTGLGNAERLHNYFAEKKRGRVDFELQVASDNSKSSNSGGAGIPGDKAEELLYGYVGCAEDLDKVDFDTKKRILIKSKEEIQELANDPVKHDER